MAQVSAAILFTKEEEEEQKTMGITIEEYREAHLDYNRHLGAAAEVAKPDPKEEANAMLIGRMSWHVRWLQYYKLLYLFYSHFDRFESFCRHSVLT